jgi:hypothetical protein
VRSQNSTYIDHTESFFFAEVIKYIYLTFDEPEKYSLDKYVVGILFLCANVGLTVINSSTLRLILLRRLTQSDHSSLPNGPKQAAISHPSRGMDKFLKSVVHLVYRRNSLTLLNKSLDCK